MKNILKRIRNDFTCIVMSLILLLSPIQTPVVYAAEPQFSSSTVTYTVDDSFYVQIPETITVGDSATIYAIETNISEDKMIYVRIDGLDEYGCIKLTNDADSSYTISTYFMDSSGNKYSNSNNLIGTFSASGNDGLTFNTGTDANPSMTKAGSYTGRVYFSIICE